MKITASVSPAAVAFFAAIAFAAAAVAQAPPAAGGSPMEGPGHEPRNYPAPKNLKVLPKNLSGKEVHEIMEGWAGDLGVHCDHCHAADPKNIGPNGRPRLNFASDEKDGKKMARIMYTMLQVDKKNYVAKVAAMDKMDEPAAPLTCGTCHRGHLDPEKFTPPPHPQGAPGAMPGMQH